MIRLGAPASQIRRDSGRRRTGGRSSVGRRQLRSAEKEFQRLRSVPSGTTTLRKCGTTKRRGRGFPRPLAQARVWIVLAGSFSHVESMLLLIVEPVHFGPFQEVWGDGSSHPPPRRGRRRLAYRGLTRAGNGSMMVLRSPPGGLAMDRICVIGSRGQGF